VFATTIVWNLREVEDEASLILRGYVPLALAAASLKQYEEDLRSYLDQGITDANRPIDITRALTLLRSRRDRALNEILSGGPALGSLVTSDGAAAAKVARLLPATLEDTAQLKQKVDAVDPLFKALLAAPPLHIPHKTDASFQAAYDALDPPHRRAYDALVALRDSERAISGLVAGIQARSYTRAQRDKDWLADNERTILLRAIYLGIVAVVLGLAITAWFAVMLRPLRRLREGARRIAAGDYGKRISETGPTEIADLAREFNSMGRAVQEREAEKLRAARIAIAGKMAGQVAHEDRNPLSSIGLNTELLEDELGDSERESEARELCRKIRNEVDRLTQVTEIYLGLRGGKPKLARESLNAIVDDLAGFVRKDLGNRRVLLETELDPEDPTGNVDASHPAMFDQLVRNAADVSAWRRPVVVRTRGARAASRSPSRTTGSHASGHSAGLFEPFFDEASGTGLGLALTQQIIRTTAIRVASRSARYDLYAQCPGAYDELALPCAKGHGEAEVCQTATVAHAS
jgi:signal transduction histidine kinase